MVVRVSYLIAVVAAVALLGGGILLGRTALAEDESGKIVLSSPDETVTLSQEQLQQRLQADYDSFRERANVRSAEANLRSAIPAIEAYYSDNDTYVGMDLAVLREIDAGLPASVVVARAEATSYCVQVTEESATAHYDGPGGSVLEGPCA